VRTRGRWATLCYAVALFALAAIAGGAWLVGPLEWKDSDSLFYEAQRLELLGRSADEAVAEVFDGDKARAVAVIENDADPPHVLDPPWVEYSTQFYRRRWSVPAMGAAIDPIFGDRSLQVVAFVGYLALGPAIFLLLLRRYARLLAAGVSAVCLLLPPVHKWSLFLGVDSWGLVFEMLAFLGLVALLAGGASGRGWWAVWIGSMLALSVTRDATVALLLGTAWVAWRERHRIDVRRRNLLVLGTGVAASVPAVLLFHASVKNQLAYVINGYYVPDDTSWGYVLRGYPAQLGDTLERNLSYPLDYPLPVALVLYVGLAALAALVVVFLLRAPREPYFDVHRGAMIGYVLFLGVAANPQGYRLELIGLPTLAVALAWGVGAAFGNLWRDTRLARSVVSRVPG
jgi:hypothetical protein